MTRGWVTSGAGDPIHPHSRNLISPRIFPTSAFHGEALT